jgi:hypothetical protein
MRTSTNFFLFSLAMSDLTVLLVGKRWSDTSALLAFTLRKEMAANSQNLEYAIYGERYIVQRPFFLSRTSKVKV